MLELIGLFVARLVVKLGLMAEWLRRDNPEPMQGDLSDPRNPTGEQNHEED